MVTTALRRNSQRTALRAAVRVLKQGGVVAFPTETTYGLGCDPRNAKAVAKIFKIKGRDKGKPLQLIAGSWVQVMGLADLEGVTRRLTRRYWPGPLTLLIPVRSGTKLMPRVRPKNIIGIRISSHLFARQLALAFGSPLAATSANRSGSRPALSGRSVIRAFRNRPITPDLVLDAGALPRRKPSTVARVLRDGSIQVLRAGLIRLKQK